MNKRQHSHKIKVMISKERKAIKKCYRSVYPTFKTLPRWREKRRAYNLYIKKCIAKGKLPENLTEILYKRILNTVISKRHYEINIKGGIKQ